MDIATARGDVTPGAVPRASYERSSRILAAACLALAIPLALIALLHLDLTGVFAVPDYLVFHNVAEFFAIATSFATFAVAWFTREHSEDEHALVLGSIFLGIGLMDLMHTLGYSGMPALLTPNSALKSTQFWIATRFLSAAAFLGSAFVRPTSHSRWLPKWLPLAAALTVSGTVFVLVTFFPGLLPATFVPGTGLTPFKKDAEAVIVLLLGLAAAAYWRRASRSSDPVLALDAAALVILAISEIPFAVYSSVFDAYNVLGHVYKVTAFALVFRGSFIASVQRPRLELLAKEEALRKEVAEREAAEAERRRTEGKFTAFAQAADQVFWITRLAPEGVLYVNPAFEAVWGIPADAVQRDPRAWTQAIHPEDRDAVEAAFARWLAGPADAPYDVQYRIVRPDGGIRWIADRGFVLEREGGEIRLVAGVARDVTQRIVEEAAARESERRLRRTLDGMMEGCLLVSFDWTYLYVNEAAARQRHQRREEMIGRSMLEAFRAGEETPVYAAYRRCMEERVPQRFEAPLSFPDGTTGQFELSVEPAVEGIFVLSLDVTERRKAEEQLRQSQKLEAIGRLAGGVAHDFNNLLTVISGGCGLLLESLPAQSQEREEVEEIRAASERAAALTRQLLSFSRRHVTEPTVLDLNEIVEGMDRMLRRLIGEDIELVTVFGASPSLVRAEPSQLEQVIVNLVVNARDAMPDGGRLTIETSNLLDPDEPGLPRGSAAPDRHVVLAIGDSGCGMTPEVQAHLFEPFFTTKEPGKGTGLGLSTVYGIVQQGGGRIRVRSAPGRGSRFEVLLPRAEEPAGGVVARDQASRRSAPRPCSSSRTSRWCDGWRRGRCGAPATRCWRPPTARRPSGRRPVGRCSIS